MKILRGLFVVFGALTITALGIDAADSLNGSRSTLLGQLIGGEVSVCPEGMTEVPNGLSFLCVDTYEAAPGENCTHKKVASVIDTKNNIDTLDCEPASEEGVLPWTFVSRDQAQALCLRAGKRLPSNSEWQVVALGSIESKCNLSSGGVTTAGELVECRSSVGVYDAVGNVWEWTADEVIQGRYNGRLLPETGYVSAADNSGIAVETSDVASSQYSEDYFWNNDMAAAGIMRGGFYSSDSDGGLYAAHTDIAPSYQGGAIGFRCVK